MNRSARQMKILYITKQLPYGGTEAFILPEAFSHRRVGWEVWFAPLSHGELVHEEAQAFLSRTLDRRLISPAIVMGALRQITSQPLDSLCAVGTVLTSNSVATLIRNLVVLPKALWLAGEIRHRQFDHVHIHWAAAPATMGAIAATLANIPFSMTAHRYDIKQNNLLSWKSRRATFVRAIDQPGASEIEDALSPGDPLPLVIHMGVEVPSSTAQLRTGLLSPLKVIAAARLVKKKGLNTLIDAASIAKEKGVDVEIDIFGDGPLHEELAQQIRAASLGMSVTLKGTLSHDRLLTLLGSGLYDVGALPSITAEDGDKEGIPVFLIEAMAAGLPVITTGNGGILELVGDDSGAVVGERDPGAIADVFVELARDENMRKRYAGAARRKVLSEFEIEASMNKLRNLIMGGAEERGTK